MNYIKVTRLSFKVREEVVEYISQLEQEYQNKQNRDDVSGLSLFSDSALSPSETYQYRDEDFDIYENPCWIRKSEVRLAFVNEDGDNTLNLQNGDVVTIKEEFTEEFINELFG